jgi:hypothetical protein
MTLMNEDAPKKEAASPREWNSGRLKGKIFSARNGDDAVSRELLRMAAIQYLEHDDIEPDLRRYLESILLELANAPISDVAKVLNFSTKKNPAHRPTNMNSVMHKLRAWGAARVATVVDSGDEDYVNGLAKKILQIDDESILHAKVEFMDDEVKDVERFGVRYATTEDTFELASKIYNNILKNDQSEGRRLDEPFVTWSAIKSAVYRAKHTMDVEKVIVDSWEELIFPAEKKRKLIESIKAMKGRTGFKKNC